MASSKENCWLEFHHIITTYNDHNDTALYNVRVREAANQVMLEERVIEEANNVTVDKFMVRPTYIQE